MVVSNGPNTSLSVSEAGRGGGSEIVSNLSLDPDPDLDPDPQRWTCCSVNNIAIKII